MKLLLHTCCGPCSIYPVQTLGKSADVAGLFYNPNIHPFTEWQARRDALAGYAADVGLGMVFEDDYNPGEWFREIVFNEDRRCELCYRLRLAYTARVAREKSFDAFSTTLLVSPYQDHDLVRKIGGQVEEASGVKFHYEDFRPGYRYATARSRELGMYRQKYCGCLYSEKERFYRKTGGGI